MAKEKTPYSEELANELIAKFNLSEKTKKVWKTRGTIPSQYTEEDFEKRIPLTERKDIYEEEKIAGILANPKINRKAVAEFSGIKYTYINDATKPSKRTPLTLKQLIAVKKCIQELRLSIKKVIEPLAGKVVFSDKEKESLTKLLNDERIVIGNFFAPDLKGRITYQEYPVYFRHIERSRGKVVTFEDYEASQIRDLFVVFILELTF